MRQTPIRSGNRCGDCSFRRNLHGTGIAQSTSALPKNAGFRECHDCGHGSTQKQINVAKRATTIGLLAGFGAIAALLVAARSYAASDPLFGPVTSGLIEDEYGPNEAKGAGIVNDFYGVEPMNFKVNEYPKYASAIAAAESRYNIPTDLLARVLYQESRFRPDIISGEKRSPVGALGIAQFMPLTGEEYGLVDFDLPPKTPGRKIIADRRYDPFASIDAAGRYLRVLYRMFGEWRSALMAYNWGPGNVAKYNRGEAITVPIETSQYVAQITADVQVA